MNNIKKKLILYFLAIIAINLLVFWPSFSHKARGDQLWYLVEVANCKDMGSLFEQSISYPRTRIMAVGDQILYRPILFTFMALQKMVFGYHFVYWQLMSFFLHLLALWQIFNIFNKIRSSPFFAALFVLNLSVLFVGQEMVIWHGISGYLLALNFMLAAFNSFIDYIYSGQNDQSHQRKMTLYLLLACFTFEFSVFFSLVLVMALAWHRRYILKESLMSSVRQASRSLWPVGFYIVVSSLDYALHPGFAYHTTAVAGNHPLSLLEYSGRFVQAIVIFFTAILFPQFLQISALDRAQITGFNYPDIINHFSHYNLGELLNVAMLVIGAILGVITLMRVKKLGGLKNESTSSQEPGDKAAYLIVFAGVGFALTLMYIAMILFGRNVYYLTTGLYHFYMISVFLGIGLYSLAGFYAPVFRSVIVKNLIICLLLSSILINGKQCFNLNTEYQKINAAWCDYIFQLEKFVNQHKREGRFSFDIVYGDPTVEYSVIYGPPATGIIVKKLDYQFLFSQYVKSLDPAYYVVYTNARGLASFASRQDAESYARMVLTGAGVIK